MTDTEGMVKLVDVLDVVEDYLCGALPRQRNADGGDVLRAALRNLPRTSWNHNMEEAPIDKPVLVHNGEDHDVAIKWDTGDWWQRYGEYRCFPTAWRHLPPPLSKE